jgi:soluble lytic murein transglycosylase-like protein
VKAAALLLVCTSACAADPALQYRATLIREAQAVYGVQAPVPMFAGQIRQESSLDAGVTAWDGGMGLAQFMTSTAQMISRTYPELGTPDPYNPRWAIRALVRYDGWLYARVQGATPCEKWGAALKSYNAGLGYVRRAQRQSSTPQLWWRHTEDINAGQSTKNFTYSRAYPRRIIWRHQPQYRDWGVPTCGAAP